MACATVDQCTLHNLPANCLVLIIKHVSAIDRIHLRRVSKRFCFFAESEQAWECDRDAILKKIKDSATKFHHKQTSGMPTWLVFLNFFAEQTFAASLISIKQLQKHALKTIIPQAIKMNKKFSQLKSLLDIIKSGTMAYREYPNVKKTSLPLSMTDKIQDATVKSITDAEITEDTLELSGEVCLQLRILLDTTRLIHEEIHANFQMRQQSCLLAAQALDKMTRIAEIELFLSKKRFRRKRGVFVNKSATNTALVNEIMSRGAKRRKTNANKSVVTKRADDDQIHDQSGNCNIDENTDDKYLSEPIPSQINPEETYELRFLNIIAKNAHKFHINKNTNTKCMMADETPPPLHPDIVQNTNIAITSNLLDQMYGHFFEHTLRLALHYSASEHNRIVFVTHYSKILRHRKRMGYSLAMLTKYLAPIFNNEAKEEINKVKTQKNFMTVWESEEVEESVKPTDVNMDAVAPEPSTNNTGMIVDAPLALPLHPDLV